VEREMSGEYETVTVPVRGGGLTAGIWNPDAAAAALAFHGITASHVSWVAIARALSPAGLIAPDLRGRGGSRALPAPFGMATHAEDAARLLDSRGIDRIDVVGHSMGGFVAMRFAELYPDRVRTVTLVDGGVPLPIPPDIPIETVMRSTLGPALERLEMTYPDPDAYRAFWRAHTAFARDWNGDVEAYVDYDLVRGGDGAFRSSASGAAVLADAVEQGTGTIAERPWTTVIAPITFLRAERGMMDGPEGLYAADYVDAWGRGHPALRVIRVPGVNHYTIVLNKTGADAVVGALATNHEFSAGSGQPE
jgi:lipase